MVSGMWHAEVKAAGTVAGVRKRGTPGSDREDGEGKWTWKVARCTVYISIQSNARLLERLHVFFPAYDFVPHSDLHCQGQPPFTTTTLSPPASLP